MKLPALLALALIVARPLSSQTPAEGRALDAFRDTIARIHSLDSLAVLAVPFDTTVNTPRAAALWRLRRGFLHLRQADLKGDRGAFLSAGQEFESISTFEPEWGYPWFGRGLAEVGGEENQSASVLALQRALGKDPLKHAKEFLGRGIEVDPTLGDIIAPFLVGAVRQNSEGRLEVSLAVVRATALLPGSRRPALLFARGMVERVVGEVDTAITALGDYLLQRPDDADGLFELSKAMLQAGKLDGAASWYRGLELADGTTLARYRDDLGTLMPDSTLTKFDAAHTPAARVAVARTFWMNRDRDGIPAAEERLRDHYVRLKVARHAYTLSGQLAVIQPLPELSGAMDDRGAVYVRDGAPDVQTYVDLPGVAPNQTWWYKGQLGDTLLFNFQVRAPYPGYRLVPSLFDLLATSGQAKIAGRFQQELSAGDSTRPPFETYGAGLLAQTAQELLAFRQSIPLYSKMLGAGIKESIALQADERTLGVKSIALEESWKLGYELPLQASIDFLALGGDATGPVLQIAFAVPVANMTPTRIARGFSYPVRMRAAVLNARGEVVARIDTTRNFFSTTALPVTSNLLGRLPVRLPPGVYSARVALESRAVSGILTPKTEVRLAAFDRPALTMSDIAIGTRSVRLTVPGVHGDSAWINPLHSFSRKQPLELYAELGGLQVGAVYHTDITVARLNGDGEVAGKGTAAMKFGVDGKKSALVDVIRREIAVSRLSAGEYLLTVTVSTADGERVSRQQRFTVTKE